MVSFTPNASATCRCRAAPVSTRHAAASRRPAPSSASHTNATIPLSQIWPPSSDSTRSTPGTTGTEHGGDSSNGGSHTRGDGTIIEVTTTLPQSEETMHGLSRTGGVKSSISPKIPKLLCSYVRTSGVAPIEMLG